jgi:predicted glycosyltransferase
VAESALSAEALAAAIDRAASGPPPKRGVIDLGGAQRSAALLAQWIREHSQ